MREDFKDKTIEIYTITAKGMRDGDEGIVGLNGTNVIFINSINGYNGVTSFENEKLAESVATIAANVFKQYSITIRKETKQVQEKRVY